MKFSKESLALLKQLQPMKARAYQDPIGQQLIGYGHRIIRGDGVSSGSLIDESKADSLLDKDIAEVEDCLNDCVIDNINQNQFDALVMLTLGIGVDSFRRSALLNYVNSKDYEAASKAFLYWSWMHTKQGGFVEIFGLKERRLAEQALFTKPVEQLLAA